MLGPWTPVSCAATGQQAGSPGELPTQPQVGRGLAAPGFCFPPEPFPLLSRRKLSWRWWGPERRWVPPAETGTGQGAVSGGGRLQGEHMEFRAGQRHPQTWPPPTAPWKPTGRRDTAAGLPEGAAESRSLGRCPVPGDGGCLPARCQLALTTCCPNEEAEAPGGLEPCPRHRAGKKHSLSGDCPPSADGAPRGCLGNADDVALEGQPGHPRVPRAALPKRLEQVPL